MTKLEELQAKRREKRTPLEQCIVDAVTFEEAEHDGEIEVMEKAVEELMELREYKRLYNTTARLLNTANNKLSFIQDIIKGE